MVPFQISRSKFEEHKAKGERNLAAANDLALRYGSDEALRARIDSGDVGEFLSDLGIDLPGGIEGRIVFDTADTHHFVLPPDPNAALSDEMLSMVAGGKSAGSAGSVGSAGSALCSCGASTVSSAGTAGTAGTAS